MLVYSLPITAYVYTFIAYISLYYINLPQYSIKYNVLVISKTKKLLGLVYVHDEIISLQEACDITEKYLKETSIELEYEFAKLIKWGLICTKIKYC